MINLNLEPEKIFPVTQIADAATNAKMRETDSKQKIKD